MCGSEPIFFNTLGILSANREKKIAYLIKEYIL
jgi:hypothetical protein